MTASFTTDTSQRDWFIVERWQEYEGEGRANLLRVIGIIAFYGIELLNYYGLRLGPLELPRLVDRPFHIAMTALAVAWVLLALATHAALSQQIFPAFLKYLTTAGDLILLTGMLCMADGPRSPLVIGYFLIVALAALRLRLELVWFATAGAVLGYLWVLGFAKWYAERDLSVPRYYQLIFLLGLILLGIVLGQVLRRVRRMAEDFARRIEPRGDRNAANHTGP